MKLLLRIRERKQTNQLESKKKIKFLLVYIYIGTQEKCT